MYLTLQISKFLKFSRIIILKSSFIFLFTILICNVLVVRFSSDALLENIELSETEVEELCEADIEEFIYVLDMDFSLINKSQLFRNIKIKLLQNFIEISTPPPEVKAC